MKINMNKIPPMMSKGTTNDLKLMKSHLHRAAEELSNAKDILAMYKLFEDEHKTVDDLEFWVFNAYREFNTLIYLRGYKEDK